MRIAELSKRTGVTKPTIKYYIREGLVPPGEAAGRNQANYGEEHEQRIRLVRALSEVGGLSIAATRDVLGQIRTGRDLDRTLGRVLAAVVDTRQVGQPDESASRQVEDLIKQRGWQVDNQVVRDALAWVISSFHRLGEDDLLGVLDSYADAAEQIATADLEIIGRRDDVDAVVEGAIVGTVLGGALLLALRRCAQVDASGRALRGRSKPPARSTRRVGSKPQDG
jgi:DNA-binding transcriptional MerR regulator